jgi:hypothetical protein
MLHTGTAPEALGIAAALRAFGFGWHGRVSGASSPWQSPYTPEVLA